MRQIRVRQICVRQMLRQFRCCASSDAAPSLPIQVLCQRRPPALSAALGTSLVEGDGRLNDAFATT